MGLDMYLKSGTGLREYDYKYVEVVDEDEIGYWRKANAIHGWFVKNVQSDVDDCANYEVSREQLQNLRETVEQALDGPESAMHYLPPVSGFFFGSRGIDSWYFDDLRMTLEFIDRALSVDSSRKIYYRASW